MSREGDRRQQDAYKGRRNSSSSRKDAVNGPQSTTIKPPPLSTTPFANAGPTSQQNDGSSNVFNIHETALWLNSAWQTTLSKSQDPNIAEEDRPEVFRNTEKAWSNKSHVTAIFGVKGGMLPNGEDFLGYLMNQQRSKT